MRTPWGDLRVCDAHVHFFSHRFFSMLAAQKGAALDSLEPPAGVEIPPPEPERLAQRWEEELDRYGVARSVLIASLPGDEDSVIAAVRFRPERFYGYFFLDPTQPDAERRAVRGMEAGLRGICLFPAMHRYPLNDERAEKIYRAAAAHPGTAVFVHCGVLTVGIRRKLGLPSQFDMRFSNPIDLHPVALRYPSLPFIVPHFGGGYFREALMLADLCPNVRFDTSSSNSWIRYQTGDLDLERVFRRALDIAGPERLLFGTDSSFFPRGWQAEIFETQCRVLAGIGLSAADARRILGGNLESLLG